MMTGLKVRERQMRLLESKRYRDDLKKAISNTDLSELNNKSILLLEDLA